MKLDQIAWYAHTEKQVLEIKNLFGLAHKDWIEDFAFGDAELGGRREDCRAHLRFNYDLGIEMEILTYLDDFNWHAFKRTEGYFTGEIFLSHYGFHLEEDEPFPRHTPGPLVQEMWTNSHTNPYLLERKRTYHYRIHDARETLGAYIKYIKRIQP